MDVLSQAVTDAAWTITAFTVVMVSMLLALAVLLRRLPRPVRTPVQAVLSAVVIYAAFRLVIA